MIKVGQIINKIMKSSKRNHNNLINCWNDLMNKKLICNHLIKNLVIPDFKIIKQIFLINLTILEFKMIQI